MDRKRSTLARTTSGAALLAALLVGSPAVAADAQGDRPAVDPPGGETLKMDQHMTGSVGETGEFPGRLVCLRSKDSFAPLSASECAAGARVYALEMKGESTMRPIQAGSPQVEAQLQDLLGKSVRVSGKFHNETNTVLASSVRLDDHPS